MPPSPTDPTGASTEYARMSSELFRTWEKAMGAWWDQVLETPAFLGAVNQGLGQASKGRGAWTQAVDQTLEQAHLPTRGDMVRTLKVMTLLEERLLAQEDLLLELRDRLGTAEAEALRARIDATEARIELRERLDGIVGRLEAMLPALAAPTEGGTAAGSDKAPAAPPSAPPVTPAAPARSTASTRRGKG